MAATFDRIQVNFFELGKEILKIGGLPDMMRRIAAESACNIRKRFRLESSCIWDRLIESATITTQVVGTVFHTKHITYS